MSLTMCTTSAVQHHHYDETTKNMLKSISRRHNGTESETTRQQPTLLKMNAGATHNLTLVVQSQTSSFHKRDESLAVVGAIRDLHRSLNPDRELCRSLNVSVNGAELHLSLNVSLSVSVKDGGGVPRHQDSIIDKLVL